MSKQIGCPESIFSSRQLYQESISHEDTKCTGRCKAVVRRIVEQVRAETEQWSQMQEMLRQVKEEMEELQSSHKFWEDNALNSDHEVQSLQSSVQEWKEKALSLETKAITTETELAALKMKFEKMKTAKGVEPCRAVIENHIKPLASISEQLQKENYTRSCIPKKNHLNVHQACKEGTANERLIAEQNTDQIMASTQSLPLSLGKQLEKEKRMLRRLKDKYRTSTEGRRKLHAHNTGLAPLKRSPFHDIGNLSEL